MFEKEVLMQLIAGLHDALGGLQMSSKSSNITTAVVVGVAITAVAGVAVAVAVGGSAFLNDGRSSKAIFLRCLPPILQMCGEVVIKSFQLIDMGQGNAHRRSQTYCKPYFTRSYKSGPFRRRWRRRKHQPLTQQLWTESFEAEGRLSNSGEKLIRRVRWGGIEPKIRAEVWPFLLGLYEIDSSGAERDALDAKRRQIYENIRKQCQEIRKSLAEKGVPDKRDGIEDDMEMPFSDSQIEEFTGISGCKTFWEKGLKAVEDLVTWQRIIRLDAVRMNAEWVPYSPSQANVTAEYTSKLAEAVGLADDEHLETCRRYHAARLVAILEAYALYDPETGYCQGMSDLLSPFVALMDEDFEAFWCFVHFMRTARHNFRLDEVGIRRQLNTVADIIKTADPELYQHLVKIKSEDCTFVYRMVVVLFRRELSFEQTICLWEVIWADWTAIRACKVLSHVRKKQKVAATKDLLLFTIAAAVCRRRKFIMENCRGMDEVLRECNAMAGNLDVWLLLDDARELVNRVHAKGQPVMNN